MASRCRLCVAFVLAASTANAEPITLRQAVDTALQHRPSLAATAGERDAATARVGRARAAFLPRLRSTISMREDYRDPLDFTSSTPIGWTDAVRYDVNINVDQLVLDWGVTRNQIASARAVERQLVRQVAIDRLDVELEVVAAYLELLRHADLLAVSATAIDLVEEQLARATALFNATLRPEIDVLSAQTQRGRARLARARDENAVRASQLALAKAIGVLTLTPDPAPVEIGPLVNEERLLANQAPIPARAELAVLDDATEAADATARVAESRGRPVLALQVGMTMSGGTNLWVPGMGVFASVGVSMSLDRANHYQVNEARAMARRARAEHQRVDLEVRLSVRRAALGVEIAREVLAVARAWRTQAERQLQIARARYQSSVGNFVELNDARAGVVEARRQEVEARYDLALSRTALARELGQSPAALAIRP